MAYWNSGGCVHSRISRGVRPKTLDEVSARNPQACQEYILSLEREPNQVDDLSKVEQDKEATQPELHDELVSLRASSDTHGKYVSQYDDWSMYVLLIVSGRAR